MIALTQEKRQKRIDWLKNRISSMEQCRDEIPFGLSDDESMELSAYKDSLASLTAEKRATVDVVGVIWNEWKPEVGTPLFTAPLVPEIKIPSIEALAGEYKYQVSPHDIVLLIFAINVIKRLNGLGE